ncbi:DNA adenine methylase [Thermogemmatispora carboxidivorans]|uniref:DNA adenine methylase n=1 Tax=Thermogemmatispora carboxidivorans TaxID=1382306 RepID=UPI00192E60D3|nr:DNA adenine methylase [Thermogemmatispora carboxidivorans]
MAAKEQPFSLMVPLFADGPVVSSSSGTIPSQGEGLLRPVNVASVPQRSPFRYPGGKTWLVPYIRRWLSPTSRAARGLSPARPTVLLEPFAGGGSVSLTAVAEGFVEQALMVELDEDVAAVWQTLLQEKPRAQLLDLLHSFELTPAGVENWLTRPRQALSLAEHAFQTLLRNRVSHGGILAPGAGLLKHGEDGRGLRSRWYPATLRRRIEEIARLSPRLAFIHGDGLEQLRQYQERHDVVSFIDPPYTLTGKRAGRRLYRYAELDHEALFALVSCLTGDFLVTYDDTPEVRALARRYGLALAAVPMRTTHHTQLMELLIGRDLRWLETSQPS